jgi:hypothetical protein
MGNGLAERGGDSSVFRRKSRGTRWSSLKVKFKIEEQPMGVESPGSRFPFRNF